MTTDNTEDFNYINDLIAEYKRTTFNVTTQEYAKVDTQEKK